MGFQSATVVDHLQMQVKCTCGHCCKGRFPESVNAPVSYGPNIVAMTSYLSTYQNVPFKRLTRLFETIFGLHISEGSVSNMLNAMRKLSKTPYEMIRRKVAGADGGQRERQEQLALGLPECGRDLPGL